MADSKLTNVREFTSKLVSLMEDAKAKAVICHVSVEGKSYIPGRGYPFITNYISGRTNYTDDSGCNDKITNLYKTLDNAVNSINVDKPHTIDLGIVSQSGKILSQDVIIRNGNINQKPVEAKKFDLTHRPDGYFPPIKPGVMNEAYRKKADEEAFRGN